MKASDCEGGQEEEEGYESNYDVIKTVLTSEDGGHEDSLQIVGILIAGWCWGIIIGSSVHLHQNISHTQLENIKFRSGREQLYFPFHFSAELWASLFF